MQESFGDDVKEGEVREFDTGATRDTDEGMPNKTWADEMVKGAVLDERRTVGTKRKLDPQTIETTHADDLVVVTLREFDSGATRDTAEGKPEYGGFLSPLVLQRFGEYMHKHREQSDGSLRASDNWQKGIPVRVYLESLLRHVMDIWLYRLGFGKRAKESYEEALCAALFNIQGLLFEELKEGAANRVRRTRENPGGCC